MADNGIRDLIISGETLRDPLQKDDLENTPDSEKSLKDFLVTLSDSLTEPEENGAERRRQVGHKNTMFYCDQHLTWDNPDTGFAEPMDIPPGEFYWQNDQFSPMVDSLVKEIAKSRPEYNFFTETEDIDKSQVARICNAIVHHYQTRLLTWEFLEKEAKQCMFYGGSWRYLRWSEDEGPEVDVEEEVEEEVELMPAEEGQEAITDKVKSRKVTGKKRAGGFVLESVCDDEILVNSTAKDMSWVGWLRRDRDLDRALVRAMHPNARVFNAGNSQLDDFEANKQSRRAKQRRQAFGGANRDVTALALTNQYEGRDLRYTEEWFTPVYYNHYETMQEEVLPNGDKIPQGKNLAEVYPTGMKVCYVNGEIVGIYEEKLHDWWDYVPYRTVPGRFHGKSVEAALPLQEWLNELVSLIMTHAMEASAPTRVADGNVFPDNISVSGVPSQIWKTQSKPIEVPMSSVFAVFPPGDLNNKVYELIQVIMTQMQAVMGAWSAFGAGAPDAAGNTATGLSLMQEAATNLMASVLKTRADADRRLAKLIVKHFKVNANDKMTFEIGGPHSREKAIKLAGADIDFDVEISVKEGSYFPRQEFQRRNDMLEYYTALKVMAEAKQMMMVEPTIDEERLLAERFNVPEAISVPMQAMDAAKRVWDLFEKKAKMIDAQQVERGEQEGILQLVETMAIEMPDVPPEALIEEAFTMAVLDAAPIRKFSDYHVYMAKAFRVLLNTDEGFEVPPHMVKAIERRIEEHLVTAREIEPMYMGGPTPSEIAQQQAMMQEQQAGMEETDKANKLLGKQSGAGSGRSGSTSLPTGRPSMPATPVARRV